MLISRLGYLCTELEIILLEIRKLNSHFTWYALGTNNLILLVKEWVEYILLFQIWVFENKHFHSIKACFCVFYSIRIPTDSKLKYSPPKIVNKWTPLKVLMKSLTIIIKVIDWGGLTDALSLKRKLIVLDFILIIDLLLRYNLSSVCLNYLQKYTCILILEKPKSDSAIAKVIWIIKSISLKWNKFILYFIKLKVLQLILFGKFYLMKFAIWLIDVDNLLKII